MASNIPSECLGMGRISDAAKEWGKRVRDKENVRASNPGEVTDEN